MKLIVDVPHSLYANLSTIKNESVAGKRILECVKNGTPLPKGHGRLIDVDDLEVSTGIIDDWSERDFVYLDEIEDAPTIIEADKEDKK